MNSYYQSLREARTAKLEMLKVIAKTLGMKNEYTEKHSESMLLLSVETAKKLSFSMEQLEDIEYGTILHDIGKIAVPDNILNKPGKLTPEEFEIMKKHSLIGYELLKDVFEPISLIIRDHHEKLDGSGYPNGIKNVDPEAQLVACADIYDALTSKRPYKNEISHEKAIDIMITDLSGKIDDKILTEFLKTAEEFKNWYKKPPKRRF